jgi:hypothetical protein
VHDSRMFDKLVDKSDEFGKAVKSRQIWLIEEETRFNQIS